MGRYTQKLSPLLSRTTALMPAFASTALGTWEPSYESGVYRYDSQLISATTTATVMSIDGPGVIGFFQLWNQLGNNLGVNFTVYIDDNNVMNHSCTFSQNVALNIIGAQTNYAQYATYAFDPVPFETSFRVFVKSTLTPQCRYIIKTLWRQTS